MKKYLMTALVLVASASLFTVSAAKKKKNVKKVTPVVLATESDSLSYAAGVHATRGLIPFIQQSYQVDTAYMADFIRGYEEAIAKANTPQGTAYIVGMQIAQMVNQRILPGTREELKSAKDSIDAAMFSRGFVAALANDTTLIGENHGRVVHQSSGDGHTLHLSTRHLVALVIESLAQAHSLQGFDGTLLALLGCNRRVVHQWQLYILHTGSLRQKVVVLEDETNLAVAENGTVVAAHLSYAHTIQIVFATGWRVETSQLVQ